MNSRTHFCFPDVDFSFFFFLLGLGLDTCVALLSINIHFLEICVLAEISLFFFLNCIT